MKQAMTHVTLIVTLVVSALLTAGAPVAAAAPPDARGLERVVIKGTAVQVGTSTPVPDATVWLILESGRVYRPADPDKQWLTRADGTFEAVADQNSLKATGGLPPGRYEVMVHKAAPEGEGPEEDLWPVRKYMVTITAERARQGPIDVGVIELARAGDMDLDERPSVDAVKTGRGRSTTAPDGDEEAPPEVDGEPSTGDEDADEPEDVSTEDEEEAPPGVPDSAPAPVAGPRLPRLVITTGGAIITRAGAAGGAGSTPQSMVLLEASGHFSEKPVDQPCDPAVTYGPFTVESGGRLRATVQSARQVPAVWSLYNGNTGLAVDFSPARLAKRESTRLLGLGGNTTDANAPYLATGEADWYSPGQFKVVIGAPSGSGPLTGSCFEQAWSAKVEIISLNPDTPADAGLTLNPGDVLRTGTGEVVIMLPDGSSLHVLRDSELTAFETGAGVTRVEVTRGKIGSWSAPGGPHNVEVVVAGKTIQPSGTQFSLQWDGQAGWLAVVEGSVTVTDAAGAQLTLTAGRHLDLASGTVGVYDPGGDPTVKVGDVPLGSLVLDDTPQPFGEYPLELVDDRLSDGWVLEDPGEDALLQSPQPGTLQLTVPDGNDMWSATTTGPRLLHKVTGDFDFETQLTQRCQCSDMTVSEFVVYAPGSYLCYLAEQMARDGLAAHYRLMGGWWRAQGVNKVGALNVDWRHGPDAPDGPAHMRLTRRGDLWKIYWSLDGQNWTLASREEIEAPDTLWVGWSFKRMAYEGQRDQAAINTLSDVRLVSAPRGSMPIPEWDFVQWAGSAQGQDGVLTLGLDGSRLGEVRALTGEPLTGDFDAIARFDAEGWQHQPGQMRGLALFAASGDDKNQSYSAMYQRDDLVQHYRTDLELDGRWGWWQGDPTSDVGGWLRLVRHDGKFQAYFWGDCEWKRLDKFDEAAPFSAPLYLGFSINNNWEASANAALTARFSLEQYPSSSSADGQPWQPQPCSLLAPVELPAGIQLPAGAQAEMFVSPFELGNLFFGPDGTAYVFSAMQGDEFLSAYLYRRDKKMLLALDADGEARRFATGDALAGVNGKSGDMLPNGDILMTVDYWPEGGTRYGGVYQLSPDGSSREWKTAQGHGGLSDIIAAPDGGWYLSDFENDNVWYLAAEGQPETPLITQGEVPRGLAALALNPVRQALYALNQTGDWPFGGTPGVYQVTPAGEAVLLAGRAEGEPNFGGLAFSQGGILPPGLYVSDTNGGRILQVGAGGEFTPVIVGLPKPAAIRFDPVTGDLLAVCDSKYLLRVGQP
jgi:FecR protein